MRPDAIDWSKRKHQVTLSLLPKQRLISILRSWIRRIIIVQAATTLVAVAIIPLAWRGVVGSGHEQAILSLAATSLETQDLAGDLAESQRLLNTLGEHDGVVFAAIVDHEGTPVILSGDATAGIETIRMALDSQTPSSLAQTTPGLFSGYRAKILYTTEARSQAEGPPHYLMLSLTNTAPLRMLASGAAAIALALLLVAAVLVPYAQRIFKRWADGLHHLHESIRHLTLGNEPKPVPVGGGDEVTYLSIAFNDMSSQLHTSRRALIKANEDLERRVEERTRELKEAASKLEAIASTDNLTQLPNRRRFEQEMHAKFQASLRNDHDLVCLAIDLDGFKGVNDTLGHAAGDELLQVAASVLRDRCRPYDIAARFGGDEFVMLLEIANPIDVTEVAERLIQDFEERCVLMYDEIGVTLRPSMSIGIASRKTVEAVSEANLLHAADEALYEAKRAGKSRAAMARNNAA